jgi:hypothetical protein
LRGRLTSTFKIAKNPVRMKLVLWRAARLSLCVFKAAAKKFGQPDFARSACRLPEFYPAKLVEVALTNDRR